MTNRRDLLRYFGVGTIIAPVIGDKVKADVKAQLIEVPSIRKVELARAIPSTVNLCRVKGMSVVLTMDDGTVLTVGSDRPLANGAIDPSTTAVEISFTAALLNTSPSCYRTTGSVSGVLA